MLHGPCDSEFYMDARSDGQNDVNKQLFIMHVHIRERAVGWGGGLGGCCGVGGGGGAAVCQP